MPGYSVQSPNDNGVPVVIFVLLLCPHILLLCSLFFDRFDNICRGGVVNVAECVPQAFMPVSMITTDI